MAGSNNPSLASCDSRRLLYMSKYGNLKYSLQSQLALHCGRPEFSRSFSEPTTHLHSVKPVGTREKSRFSPNREALLHVWGSEELIDTSEKVDFLPFATFAITAVQILLFILEWAMYGLSPIGLSLQSRYLETVLMPNQTTSEVCFVELENQMIGPRQADLIRFGALYPPCMRFDPGLNEAVVERQRVVDRSSGCCVNEANHTCHQTSNSACGAKGFQWLNHRRQNTKHPSLTSVPSTNIIHSQGDNVTAEYPAGPVCGLDPDYCLKPHSSDSMPWSEDITEWPICEHVTNASEVSTFVQHMECRVIGRPCCFGIRGECIVTTREHCEFMHGFFNPKASLCSQVNCLKRVCGMANFMNKQYPDQYFRLVTSLFVHSGLIPLVITIVLQLTFMLNLERLSGFWKISMVYLLSGCLGNLVAGYFLPYQVGTGPTPSLMGLAGFRAVCYFFYSGPLCEPRQIRRHSNSQGSGLGLRRKMRLNRLRKRSSAFHLLKVGLCKNVLLVLGLFICGFLPWVDNFAHLAGFISGMMLAFVMLPYRNMCVYTRRSLSEGSPRDISPSRQAPSSEDSDKCRFPIEIVCSVLWMCLFLGWLCLFVFGPILSCAWCNYFTCIPLAPNLCDGFRVNVSQRTPCVPDSL
ncbi:hypothetical protein PHET_02423 [Paragonimus heterotremus]|uniref:Peptidase S54 rhomboid domain-containing protein n=1 Tax=Paragonimus heterotremus TaxID=100268 RepID=A0A8J4T1L4_9TREM|nr:hypothetical protein PHET_02423 [Paragonimus heterotremus]